VTELTPSTDLREWLGDGIPAPMSHRAPIDNPPFELPPPPDPPEWLGGREPTWTPEVRAAMDAAAYRWGIPWTPKAPQ
jgi:hypothetical protein